jgi:hypothetical protein
MGWSPNGRRAIRPQRQLAGLEESRPRGIGVQSFELLSRGSSLLPDQSRQPPPEGAHTSQADLLGAPPVANTENFCSTCFHPHWGHSGGSWWRVNTIFSKTCPQLEQAYSKIGMGNRDHSLCLMSQLSCLEFPAGDAERRAQVKREIPGMRGRTRNQTTRKRTKIKKVSTVKLYAPRCDEGAAFRTRQRDCCHA